MMIKRNNFLIVILLLSFGCAYSQDTIPKDQYNLNFTAINKGQLLKWEAAFPYRCILDTNERKDGKPSLKFVGMYESKNTLNKKSAYNHNGDRSDIFKFNIFQTIHLPKLEHAVKLNVSIVSKSKNVIAARLIVHKFDRQNRLLGVDSVNIHRKNAWNIDSLFFSSENVRSIKVTLWGSGRCLDSKQTGLWLDRVCIAIGDKNIYDYPVSLISDDYYNLSFTLKKKKDFKWRSFFPTHYGIDKEEVWDRKNALKLSATKFDDRDVSERFEKMKKRSQSLPYLFRFDMSQTIFLPEGQQGQNWQVAVTSKSNNVAVARLNIWGYDRDEQLIYADSVDINNENCFRIQTLTVPSEDLKYLKMFLWGRGSDRDTVEQAFWLDGISITMNGKDIYDYPSPCDSCVDRQIVLDNNHVVPLDFSDDCCYDAIPAFSDPGISVIGIGECLHGSGTINRSICQMMKNLVQNHNCKLIMLEKGLDAGLKCDLYVRNLLPDSAFQEIVEQEKMYLHAVDEMSDFLLWLREYNKGHTKKVRVFGVDNFNNLRAFLFDYFVALNSSRRDSAWVDFLEAISLNNIEKIIDVIKEDSTIIEKLEKKEREFLFANLGHQLRMMRLYADTVDVWAFQEQRELRDYYMAERAKFLIDAYVDKGEKAVLYLHSAHVNKLDLNHEDKYIDIPNYSMGNYLYKALGDKYYVLSVQLGYGAFQKVVNPLFSLRSTPLKFPPYNSFEYVAIKNSSAYFFSPARDVPVGVSYMRWMPRVLRGSEFHYVNVSKRFDGLVFIREGKEKMKGREALKATRNFNMEQYKKRNIFLKQLRDGLILEKKIKE